jgi:hypothetical protein
MQQQHVDALGAALQKNSEGFTYIYICIYVYMYIYKKFKAKTLTVLK